MFTWRPASFSPEQSTEVEVLFEAVGKETRVSIEHRAWDTIPQKHVARHGFPEHATLARVGTGGVGRWALCVSDWPSEVHRGVRAEALGRGVGR